MKKNRFITGYSGLRTLAVIGVILYHLNPNTFIGGYLGVPIFFVLSGYLVTDHILRSYEKDGYYPNGRFYLHRIKRLYPQLITVLWVSAAWILIFQRNLLAKLNQIVITNLFGVFNIWQILNGQSYFERFASNESPFTHLWTMSIEIQFYFLWPIVIYLLIKYAKKRKTIFWILFFASIISGIEMAALYLNGVDINRIYYGTDSRFFSLGLGAAMAVIWPIEDLRFDIEKSDARVLDATGLIAFVGMILMFLSSTMNPQSAFPYCGGMFIFSILTTIMVAVIAHPGSHWNKLLTNPVFDWVGSRSYGIYLYQFPVMIFFEDKFTDVGDHPFLYHVIEIILILLLSEITYRLIEKPLSKITWEQLKSQILSAFKNKEGNHLTRIKVIVAALVILVGTAGILASSGAKVQNFNKTQLAKRINANRKEQKEDNQKAIQSLKKKRKKEKSSKIYQTAKRAAKKHPVNRSFEKYGISQVDLQLAQKVEVTAVGDSVMAGSSNDLKKLMPQAVIDAAVSRQLNVAFGLFANYQKQGALADNVLVGLGTNGPFTMNDLDRLMKQLGSKRHVFWINTHVPTRQWQGQVNDLLNKASKRYHNLRVINWYGYSKNHPAWFYDDKTHPTPNGSKYYSAFIVKSIVEHAKY